MRSDKHIILVVGVLCMIGAIMIFSTSYLKAIGEAKSGEYYLFGVLVRLLIGVTGMIIMSYVDYRRLENIAMYILIASIIPLAMTVVGLSGMEAVNGATRWMKIPIPGGLSFTFQPSEITRMALVLYLAAFFSKNQMLIEDFTKGFIKSLIFPVIIVIMLIFQPDYGTAMSIIAITLLMILIAGAKIKHLALSALVTIPIFGILARTTPYIWKRIQTYLSASPDVTDGAYQINQSLIALGSGGFKGLGLGQGKQKHFYLPEAHTDFIFSMIGEELGFIGAIVVVLLFGWFLWRGYNIAIKAEDRFGSYLAFGFVSMLFLFAIINICVVMELIPSTGMPLPFLSYGGTALVINLVAVGVILNISKNIGKTSILNEEIGDGQKHIFYGSRRNRRTYTPSFKNSSQVDRALWSPNTIHGRDKRDGIRDRSKVGI